MNFPSNSNVVYTHPISPQAISSLGVYQDRIESNCNGRLLVLDHLNKKNMLYVLGEKISDIQRAKYLFQLKGSLITFLRLMGCADQERDSRTGSMGGGGSTSSGSIGDNVSQGPPNLNGSIETNSMDSRDSLSTMSRREKDATHFACPLEVGVRADQRDFDLWVEILLNEGCSFVIPTTMPIADMQDNLRAFSVDMTNRLRAFSKEGKSIYSFEDTSSLDDTDSGMQLNMSNFRRKYKSTEKKTVNISKLFGDIVDDKSLIQGKDRSQSNLSFLGMDDWILRAQKESVHSQQENHFLSGLDVVLMDWDEYRANIKSTVAEDNGSDTLADGLNSDAKRIDKTNQNISSPQHEEKSKTLYFTHIIQHFISLMHTKCIVSYLNLTKQGTFRDKTTFLQEMNSCIAHFLRIIEGLFLILANAKEENEKFEDWSISLDHLSNLCSEEWIQENIKDWILDAIRAALLRKQIALEFINGIGVGQIVTLMLKRSGSKQLRCKCVQVLYLLLRVATLADDNNNRKYYQTLMNERVAEYLGRKLTDDLRNIRFEEDSFLTFLSKCDARY